MKKTIFVLAKLLLSRNLHLLYNRILAALWYQK